MKACCFPHQGLTPEPSQEDEHDAQDGSDSPTSHLNEANPMAKDVAAQLCDAAFVIEGKDLKAHTQVLALKSPLLADLFLSTKGQEPDVKLEESMKGISYDAMQLLLRYIYSANSSDFVKSLSIAQIKMVAPLADRFQVQLLKDHCDRVLQGKVTLRVEHPEAVLEWVVLAEHYKFPYLQAKCEAFLAGNFGALKHHIALNEPSKDLDAPHLCCQLLWQLEQGGCPASVDYTGYPIPNQGLLVVRRNAINTLLFFQKNVLDRARLVPNLDTGN